MLPVNEAVECYINSYNALKAIRVKDFVLTPLGLDLDTFISRQGEMKSEFVSDVHSRMLRADDELRKSFGLSTIITGVDEDGPHFYTIIKSFDEDHTTCADALGFAAIGIGARHAESQFMMNGQNPFSNREETLLLTHMAKNARRLLSA